MATCVIGRRLNGDLQLPNGETLARNNLEIWRRIARADPDGFIFGKNRDFVANLARTIPYDTRCAIVGEMAEREASLAEEYNCPVKMKFFDAIAETAAKKRSLDSCHEHLLGQAKELGAAPENFLGFAKAMLARGAEPEVGGRGSDLKADPAPEEILSVATEATVPWALDDAGKFGISGNVSLQKALISVAEASQKGLIGIEPKRLRDVVFVPFALECLAEVLQYADGDVSRQVAETVRAHLANPTDNSRTAVLDLNIPVWSEALKAEKRMRWPDSYAGEERMRAASAVAVSAYYLTNAVGARESCDYDQSETPSGISITDPIIISARAAGDSAYDAVYASGRSESAEVFENEGTAEEAAEAQQNAIRAAEDRQKRRLEELVNLALAESRIELLKEGGKRD